MTARTTPLAALLAAIPALTLVLVPAGMATSSTSERMHWCDGRRATLVGDEERNTLIGTRGDDVIVGLGRRDRIEGRGGDDVICGGPGDDRIQGGPGDDVILAGLDGAYEGFSSGGAEFTYVVGDQVDGGAGDDRVDLGWDRRQRDISDGRDLLSFASADGPVTLRLAGGPDAWGRAAGDGRDRVRGQRQVRVVGSRYADRLSGTPYADDIAGAGGADRVYGRGGGDVLLTGDDGGAVDVVHGGPGRDDLVSTHGPDILRGGPDNDYLSMWQPTGAATAAGGPGADGLEISLSGGSCPVLDGGVDRDRLSVRPPDDRRHPEIRIGLGGGPIGLGRAACGRVGRLEDLRLTDDGGGPWRVTGSPAGERVGFFFADEGARLIAALGGGDDVLVGGGGDDVLAGGPGRDQLVGRGGDDRGDGGPGHDECKSIESQRSC